MKIKVTCLKTNRKVRKICQSEQKRRTKTIEIKGTSDKNSAKKKFKQVIHLRKGKPTKGKADAEKVNKQTRKTENQCNKIKLLRNSKCKKIIPYLNSSNNKEYVLKI